MTVRRLALPLALALVAGSAVAVAAPARAADGPALTVDLGADRHRISPDIYGMNFAAEDLAAELRLPVRRWGGNATTRYHYRYDTTNRGSDWYFENVPGSGDPARLPDGSETDRTVEQDRRTGSRTVLTLPLIGWAPKARDFTCGFSVEKYGEQRDTDRQWRPDCGNGVRPDGTEVTGNDPHDTSVEIGPEYIRDWLGHLTGKYGTAAAGGVAYYNLDNEPDLWHHTHRDVWPVGARYEQIREATYSIGAAVKQADPSAQTLGFTGWGFNSLAFSGYDQWACNREGGSCWSNPPDRAAHGGVPIADWYLQQMRAYESEHGVRIVDYFDNHIYPQQSGVALSGPGDAATQALRLRSTRQLWDPTYVDESWIGQPIQYLPRLRSLVEANYPGTKLAVTEYNWGALGHLNGALAQADVLGIFGRERLDLATLWAPPAAAEPGAFAFRMFLNYDGAGGRFGDVGVRATSADQGRLAVYAAERSADGAVTLVVVNKTADELTSPVAIAGLTGDDRTADVYRYSGADLTSVVAEPDQAVGADGFTGTFPANSITTVVLPRAAPDTTPPTPPAGLRATSVTESSVTLAWTPATDDTGIAHYDVRYLATGNDVVLSRRLPGDAVSVRLDGLSRGTRHSVSLVAADAAGNTSGASLEVVTRGDTGPPTAPGAPRAGQVTGSTVELGWGPSRDDIGIAGYRVYSVRPGREPVLVGATGAPGIGTSTTIRSLTPRTRYTFVVRALDRAANLSRPSAPVRVRTAAG